MKKQITLLIALLVLLPLLAQANDVYSTISTSFTVQKRVNCDRLQLKFKVWAEGNTFSDALKRLKLINNEFLKFLETIYGKNEIRTQVDYSGSRTAIVYVLIDTNKVGTPHKVLAYISKKQFPYQTGINIERLSFSLSNKKAAKIKAEIFKQSLIRCKQLLKIINATLGKKYNISSVKISYGEPRPVFNPYEPRILLKAAPKGSSNGIQTASGQRIIKANVNFSAISKIE